MLDKAIAATDQKISVAANKPLVLSGKTIAHGNVTLYIFSDPKTAEVIADADGQWKYEALNLPPGDHHIEIAVTDRSSGQTSQRVNLLAFTVLPATSLQQSNPPSSAGGWWRPYGIIGGIVFIILGAAGYLWYRKRKQDGQLSESKPSKV